MELDDLPKEKLKELIFEETVLFKQRLAAETPMQQNWRWCTDIWWRVEYKMNRHFIVEDS